MMKQLLILLLVGIMPFDCSAQNNDKNVDWPYRYEGINNDPAIDPDFEKGSDKIKASIKENLNHLSLFEYAHALPELYELIDQGEIKIADWKSYVDSLESKTKAHMSDTIPAYWAVNHLGLIPLQSDFFLASLHKSEKLKNKYPKIFNDLVNNTSLMEGLGYQEEHYDSLVRVIDTKGETNFWFFVQLEDCNIVNQLKKIDKDDVFFLAGVNEVSSTYKVPFYLQKRKWFSIKRRFEGSGDEFCQKIGDRMNKISISIDENDRDYFKNSLKEGVDMGKIKEF